MKTTHTVLLARSCGRVALASSETFAAGDDRAGALDDFGRECEASVEKTLLSCADAP